MATIPLQPTTTWQLPNWQGRDFLDFADHSAIDLQDLLTLAIDLKEKQKQGIPFRPLAGKTLGMIFEKASTRTRVSFEVAMYQLGGHALFLSSSDTQLGRGEPIPDTAQVLSRYVDGLMIRTFGHEIVTELAQYASIPVINGLTDLHHPCQVLADILTLWEKKGTLKGLTVTYIGDGNNMANSWLVAAPKFGINLRIATPPGYECDAAVVEQANNLAAQHGTSILLTHDPVEAVQGTDMIYTDVWASMGQEQEQQERMNHFAAYQVNEELVKHAKPDYLFMHCLPAHRGEEVSAGVIDGPNSVIFDEAENRLHVQKAILVATMAP
ncbi:ornithine carbamoyltransferase [Tumebacillus flagellatus]|uniref:Ornithine carbamoyltransferase n=1 Tax=Tumebacillus flagellatus TaxID=1157490 RepID=A0A074LP85_9BACL|nr:ornithine carbamoyltransferase [Tumebacillus flagellatus]KEO81613.1 ornithine carbamoyltransferase [Tumebacillus flagellatus]